MLTALLGLAAVGAQAQTDKLAVQPDNKQIEIGGSAKVQANLTFFPVLHIELGSGATGKNGTDVVNLSLNTAGDYQKGKSQKVSKQLKVFSIGSGYAVKAALSSAGGQEQTAALYKIFTFGIAPTGTAVAQKNPAAKVDLLKGTAEGLKELDAEYSILAANTTDRIQAVNTLLGKDGLSKKHTVDITYSIAPN